MLNGLGEVKGQGHMVGPTIGWYPIRSMSIGPFISEIWLLQMLVCEIQGQGHGLVKGRGHIQTL